MQTCKSDIVMIGQAYAKKTGMYSNARLRNKMQKTTRKLTLLTHGEQNAKCKKTY